MPSPDILIVEDNFSKQVEIENALSSLEAQPLAVRTMIDAFRLITEQPWDLVILDMTFLVDRAIGSDSARQSMAGVELLQFMARRRLTTPVIVATQHDSFSSPDLGEIEGVEALDALLREAFPRNYCNIVKVDQSEDSWKARLLEAASKILETGY